MLPVLRSSGDLIADRRYAHAMDLAEAGEPAAARDLVAQALELAPRWPEGWMALAHLREALGDVDGCAAALETVRELDPEDRLGAVLHLARLKRAVAPSQPPAAYVRDLFDAYAPDFEAALVERLDYRLPPIIGETIETVAPGRSFRHALDLGCGTGLMGQVIKPRVRTLEGVDLSPRMVKLAASKHVYDALRVSDALTDLVDRQAADLDLVLAADVFCYLGDLRPLLSAVAAKTKPGAIIAFSVEGSQEGGRFSLKDSLRYGHSSASVARDLAKTGWHLLLERPVVVRTDAGKPVDGMIFVAQTPITIS